MQCDFCGAALPERIRQLRHRAKDDSRTYTCSVACEVERRRRDGLYKAMSAKGAAARSAAVKRSNRENPRRQKEV